MYASHLGIFLQRDPVLKGENTELGYSHKRARELLLHLYQYAKGQPTTLRDPSGMAPVRDCNLSLEVNIGCTCFLFCNPFTVSGNANNAQQTARDEADRLYPDRNDVRNRAMRHCIASGLLAISSGCRCARCIGLVREQFQNECSNQDPREGDRGEYNNRQGRDCAGCTGDNLMWGSPNQLQLNGVVACCQRKLDNGELDTGPGPSPLPID